MNKLTDVSAKKENPKWENMISRKKEISVREHDIRSDFYRDYTRIINSRRHRYFLQQGMTMCVQGWNMSTMFLPLVLVLLNI